MVSMPPKPVVPAASTDTDLRKIPAPDPAMDKRMPRFLPQFDPSGERWRPPKEARRRSVLGVV